MLKAMDEGADLSSLALRRLRRRDPARPGLRGMARRRPASRCSTASAPPRCCTSSSPTASATASPPRTGRPVTGYRAKVVDEDDERGPPRHHRPARRAGPDRLPLPRRRPPGATTSATAGTSPATPSSRTRTGYFHFAARNDDMIVSAGYNIAGPEVEAALLAHADVLECAVIGAADADRGQIVQAHVVLADGVAPDAAHRQAPAGPRESHDRPLQVPAFGDIRGRAAQDRHRQDPALRAARRQAGARENRRLRQQRRTPR